MCLNCEKVVSGVAGLAKVVAQSVGIPVDQTPDDVIQARRDACRDCEHSTKNPKRIHLPTKGLTAMSRCTICDCVIKAKTRIASQSCPLPVPKWGAVQARE